MANLDSSFVTAIAAVAGSLVGGLTSFVSSYVTQRHQGHADRVVKDLERREDLYARFDGLAAELLLDALDHSLEDPARLIGMATLTGRIRLASSKPVLEAAEAVVDELLASYQRPPIDPREVIRTAPREFLAPLVAFTAACRAERLQMLRGL